MHTLNKIEMKAEENNHTNSYLAFTLGDELYAANVKNVINIVELSKITKVPQVPDYMLGIINLRGMVLPVIDARKKFGIPTTDFTVNTCILVMEVVVNNSIIHVGALVDSVKEVIEIDENEIKDPPSIGFHMNSFFITGIYKKEEDDKLVFILNMDSVFSTDEVVTLNQHADTHEQDMM